MTEIEIVYKSERKLSQMTRIFTKEDVVKLMLEHQHFMTFIESHEMFYAIYLNQANRVLGVMKIAEGGITSTIVDVRLILQGALKTNAVNIICVHNHPSGCVIPSDADYKITELIRKCSDMMNMKMLDSLILSRESVFSFEE